MSECGSIPTHVPVFPLPDAVLFPRQVLPLHIFEPRYREMTADALKGDRCVAIALLKSGYEPHYFTPAAPIHPLVGVGRIVCASRLEDGRFNILLRGEERAEIVEETCPQAYRIARLRLIETQCSATVSQIADLRKALRGEITCGPLQSLDELFATDLTLGGVVDILASAMRVPGELRQSLLSERDDLARATQLLNALRTLRVVGEVYSTSARPDGVSEN